MTCTDISEELQTVRSARDAEGPVETFPGLPPFGIYAKRGYVCSKADRFAQSNIRPE
jgi:hypothetical protein